MEASLGFQTRPLAAVVGKEKCSVSTASGLWSSSVNNSSSSSDMAFSNSLSYALENSLKLWQPTYNGPPSSSLKADWTYTRQSNNTESSCFGAALDYSWSLEYSKETSSPSTLSISSASRTPSPSIAAATSSHPPPSFGTPSSSSSTDVYSRKVFVGGLPPDIDEDEIRDHFIQFGALTVDWPHKAQSKAYFPPKGYAFIIFQEESSVHQLIKICHLDDGKLYMFVSSVTQTNKKVQIRPWKLSDSNYIMDHTQPIDPRKTIFIGGVPRPLKAAELADIFNSRYGNVCYAGIDCDPDLKYPKGAGRVTFSSRVSFMSAVSCRFFQVTYGDIDKKVEVKPYVLDDQICDECRGVNCDGQFAPFFCGNIHCLRYYCEHCWISVHSAPGTQNHRCFIKENGDRPRAINFFSHFPNPSPRPVV
ncbi:PREDICTED: cytoplasmic polyadenylation element-binding protein 2-like [Amphimedon queenslandica]|uniref:RRM domain-containing protein n=1 Tax=Amphimedon queenslandica TaxID=400682 RepID=A0A1X7VPA9_AMPQE|nr:PREDICTED: cytoplasmic polyadenylation element-binding protein 2-like [Amphimedon queenslandica]|eukprot:XP_003383311.1 PREDICTED: cytoplasmic polyadenylation element-binding protein 2-like [Amphimedon queenslandica]